MSIPQSPGSQHQRASFASRVSGLFSRSAAPSSFLDGDRQTATYEVPLFLSPSRYEPPQAGRDAFSPPLRRSRTSTRSIIDAATAVINKVQPLSLPSSSRYSSPATSPTASRPLRPFFGEVVEVSSKDDVENRVSNNRRPTNPSTRHRRKRRVSSKHRIQSLRQLTTAFGITLLLALVTYLVLALTGTAHGIIFHIFIIILLLGLTGAFLHCFLRLFWLLQRRRERKDSQRNRTWWAQQHSHDDNVSWSNSQASHDDDLRAGHAIHIMMAEDGNLTLEDKELQTENIRLPPPIYGNFRDSKKMNPELVHVYTVPPTPLTPTYAEAMSEVQRSVGYRPPSYADTESGATQIIQTQQRDVDHAMRHMHPGGYGRLSELVGQPF